MAEEKSEPILGRLEGALSSSAVSYADGLLSEIRQTTPLATVRTSYNIDDDARVRQVIFDNGHDMCRAELIGDGETYTFTSKLTGDNHLVGAPSHAGLTLADCILYANMLLGIIPPQNFETQPCRNRH